MKLLYIANGINGSGGLERVLALKSSYLADKFNYKVHILTLNKSYQNPFYRFSSNIKFHDIQVNGNYLNYFLSYKNGIKRVLDLIKPDVISVCDDGLKGLLFPVLFGKKIPVIYERHVSNQIEIKKDKLSFLDNIKSNLKFNLMKFGGRKFDKFVVITKGNLKEWESNNLVVIPNPLPFISSEKALLKNKKVLVVGKQSFQKGYDRLLKIWKIVIENHPNWHLEVYGKLNFDLELEKKADDMDLSSAITFFPPTKNIQEKYIESSIYLMPSRFEGFGMVLIEAMSFGVPCISFDCPNGPADIINDSEDGYLIKNGDIEGFAKAILQLIENQEQRNFMGEKAKLNVQRFSPERIVPLWDELFKSLLV